MHAGLSMEVNRVRQRLRLHLAGVLMVAALILGAGCGNRPQEAPEADTGNDRARACTVWVEPGASIQATINEAAEGAVICLEEGVWEEHLDLRTSLTLRGKGPGLTVIQGHEERVPVIRAQCAPGHTCTIVLTGLTVTGGSRFGGDGVRVSNSTQVAIENVTVEENWYGVHVLRDARALIRGSILANNEYGAWVRDSGRVELDTSVSAGNRWDGVFLRDTAEATIDGSRIYGNGRYGVVLAEAPCFPVDTEFAGYVTGLGNAIPGPEEEDGNQGRSVCPDELGFLESEEGGTLDQRN